MALERISEFAHLLPGWTPTQRKILKAREEAEDRASCAGCRALVIKGLWPGHPDLADPQVQSLITEVFNQELTGTPEMPVCPYPDMEGRCQKLKRLRPNLNASPANDLSQTARESRT